MTSSLIFIFFNTLFNLKDKFGENREFLIVLKIIPSYLNVVLAINRLKAHGVNEILACVYSCASHYQNILVN